MFSQKTFDFLYQNKINNSKEWFQENKSNYNNYVLQPLTELAIELAPTISAIDEHIITEPKVDKTISRIYRDTRFSKDKMLYREEIWLSFRRDKKAYPNYPEFFFVVMPNEFIYGCGYYAATTETMDSIRKLIINNDLMFIKALKAFEQQNNFIIEGDLYKKSKYLEHAQNIRTWLDRKSLCFMCKSTDYSLLFSDKLCKKIIYTYKQMESIYHFFIYAENENRKITS
jgi:uncharacterized protein (TIGR02453 family)